MTKKKTVETTGTVETKLSITTDRNVLYKDVVYLEWVTYEVTQEQYDALCKYTTSCDKDCKTCK